MSATSPGAVSRLDRALSTVENVLAAGSLGLAAVLAIVSVVLRTFFNELIFWSEEAIIFLVIFSTFFGAVITLRYNEHVRVDVLTVFLKERGRRVLALVAAVVSLAYFGLIGWFGWALVLEPRSSLTTTPALDLPLWVVTLPLPIAFTLMFVRTIAVIVRILTGREPYPEASHGLADQGRVDE